MSRYKPKPDTRQRWDDDLKIHFRGQWYTPEQWQKMCQRAIEVDRTLDYRNDPSYWWRRKK